MLILCSTPPHSNGFYPRYHGPVELRVVVPVAACRVFVSDADCDTARYSQRYRPWRRLCLVLLSIHARSRLSTPKKLSAAALSAQLPTALMLQMTWWLPETVGIPPR